VSEITPELWNGFLEFIAEGGTGPVYLCGRGVTYAQMLSWVKKDADRETALTIAETAGSRILVKAILEELKRIGLVDIRRAYNSEGGLKNVQDIPVEVAASIIAIETEELFEGSGKDREQVGWVKRVKFSDKIRALELLGKNLQLFVDTSRVIHMGRVTLEDLVMQSIEQPKEAVREITDETGKGSEESGSGHGDGAPVEGGVSERTHAIIKASLDEGKS
jgi:hypothetical protein